MKNLSWIAGFVVALVSTPSLGIILDCDINVDGTYTCVEVGGMAVSPEAREEAAAAQRVYVEQASKECELKEPRRRSNSKSGNAGRSEDLKRAENDYQECIARKAELLRAADRKNGASTKP